MAKAQKKCPQWADIMDEDVVSDASLSSWLYNHQGIPLQFFPPIANGWCEDRANGIMLQDLTEHDSLDDENLKQAFVEELIEFVKQRGEGDGSINVGKLDQFYSKDDRYKPFVKNHGGLSNFCNKKLTGKIKYLKEGGAAKLVLVGGCNPCQRAVDADSMSRAYKQDKGTPEQTIVEDLIKFIEQRDEGNRTIKVSELDHFYRKDDRYKAIVINHGGLSKFCKKRLKDMVEFRRQKRVDRLVLVGGCNAFECTMDADLMSRTCKQDNEFAYGKAQAYGGLKITNEDEAKEITPVSYTLIVKNTFIHVHMEEADTTDSTPARLRSLSLPCLRELRDNASKFQCQ